MDVAGSERVDVGVVLEHCLALFARLDADRGAASPEQRLGWLRDARQLAARASGLAAALAGEAAVAQASEAATGTPLKVWLGRQEPLSRGEASGLARQAESLGRRPRLARAGVDGRVSPAQLRAIGKVLDSLEGELAPGARGQAEGLLVEWAGRMDARQLENCAAQVLAALVPERADEAIEARLQREADQARATTHPRHAPAERRSGRAIGASPAAGQSLLAERAQPVAHGPELVDRIAMPVGEFFDSPRLASVRRAGVPCWSGCCPCPRCTGWRSGHRC